MMTENMACQTRTSNKSYTQINAKEQELNENPNGRKLIK